MSRGARAGAPISVLLAAATAVAASAGCGAGETAAKPGRAGHPGVSAPERGPATAQQSWALLVAGSHGWGNHRHQADVLAQYQLLRSRGVSDRRIVLVAAGDIAYANENPKPGTVRQRVGEENLAGNVTIDYGPDELAAGDLSRIITGRRSRRLPHVIRSRRRDNVYIYLAGHGSRRGFYLGLDEATPRRGNRYVLLTPRRLGAAIDRLEEARSYNRLLVAVEACNAGVFGRSVRASRAALLASAGARQKSLSANYDPDGATWLADEFSYHLQREARVRPNLSLSAAHRRLARSVRGADPRAFGDLRGARLGDFFSP